MRERVIGNGPLRKVSLSLRKLLHPLHIEAEALCDNCRRRVGQPTGNAKRMIILGEVAVVEDQNEVALAWPDPLDGMTPSAGEIPTIARPEHISRRSVGA